MNKALIKTILSGGKNLFVVALIIYLVGFLLEIVLPGFVSNSFNLNWVLGVVLILGVLAAFAPEDQEEPEIVEKPKNSDYFMIAGLGIVGGLLMFYKSDLNLVPRILFSLFVAVFITAVSLYLLLAKDEEISEDAEAVGNIPPTNPVLPQIRRFLARPVKMPLGAVIIGLILLGLSLIQAKIKPQAVPPLIVAPPAEETELLPVKTIPIAVLNGSTQIGSAAAMARFLTDKNFAVSRVGDADRNDYQNAIIRFRLQEAEAAQSLAEAIGEIYPLVERAPEATDSGEIILILGNLKP